MERETLQLIQFTNKRHNLKTILRLEKKTSIWVQNVLFNLGKYVNMWSAHNDSFCTEQYSSKKKKILQVLK